MISPFVAFNTFKHKAGAFSALCQDADLELGSRQGLNPATAVPSVYPLIPPQVTPGHRGSFIWDLVTASPLSQKARQGSFIHFLLLIYKNITDSWNSNFPNVLILSLLLLFLIRASRLPKGSPCSIGSPHVHSPSASAFCVLPHLAYLGLSQY